MHPRRCLVSGASRSAGWTVYLVHLRWSSWGDVTAKARGDSRDIEKKTDTAVRVVAFEPTSCDGQEFYGGLRLSSGGRKLRLHLATCSS